MDIDKLRVVENAELYLNAMGEEIRNFEDRIRVCPEDEKQAMRKLLEELRLKYSQAYTNIVIFKAKHGIFTNIKKLN